MSQSATEVFEDSFYELTPELDEAWLLERLNAAVHKINENSELFLSQSYWRSAQAIGVPQTILGIVVDFRQNAWPAPVGYKITKEMIRERYGEELIIGLKYLISIFNLNELAVRKFMLIFSKAQDRALKEAMYEFDPDPLPFSLPGKDVAAVMKAENRWYRLLEFSGYTFNSKLTSETRKVWLFSKALQSAGQTQAALVAWALAPSVYQSSLTEAIRASHQDELMNSLPPAEELEAALAFSWRILTGEELQ